MLRYEREPSAGQTDGNLQAHFWNKNGTNSFCYIFSVRFVSSSVCAVQLPLCLFKYVSQLIISLWRSQGSSMPCMATDGALRLWDHTHTHTHTQRFSIGAELEASCGKDRCQHQYEFTHTFMWMCADEHTKLIHYGRLHPPAAHTQTHTHGKKEISDWILKEKVKSKKKNQHAQFAPDPSWRETSEPIWVWKLENTEPAGHLRIFGWHNRRALWWLKPSIWVRHLYRTAVKTTRPLFSFSFKQA